MNNYVLIGDNIMDIEDIEYLKNKYKHMRDSKKARGACLKVSNQIYALFKRKYPNLKLWRGKMFSKNSGNYEWHWWLELDNYYIDFTASQYGYEEFPLVVNKNQCKDLYKITDIMNHELFELKQKSKP